MELTQKVFIETLKSFASVKNSVAENTSSYSDLFQWRIHPENLKSARGVRLAVVVVSFLGLNPDQEINLKTQLGKITLHYHTQGEWNRVVKLLLTDPFTPWNVLKEHLSDRSAEDFFGNDIRYLKQIYRRLRVYNPYIQKKTKVVYPKRKRGYDDKGHLLGDLHGADSPRIDYRPPALEFSISNTTWFEETPLARNNKLQETLVEKNTSRSFQKGENQFEKSPNRTSDSPDRGQNRETETTEVLSRVTYWEEQTRLDALDLRGNTQEKLKISTIREIIPPWDLGNPIVVTLSPISLSEEIILRTVLRIYPSLGNPSTYKEIIEETF